MERPRSMDALIDGISQDHKFDWRSYSKETFYRDLRQLRDAGFKIDYVRKTGAYELKSVPVSLQFKPGEIVALAVACRSIPPEAGMPYAKELAGALGKISNLLSPESKETLVCNPHFQMKLKPVVDYSSHQNTIEIIRRAITDGRQVEIVYYSAKSDMKQKRIIDPYELYFSEGGVRLEGFCHLKKQLLEFRVDRIKHIAVLPTLIDEAASSAEKFVFKLWLDKKLTRSIGERFNDQKIEPNDDGTSVLTAKSSSPFRLILKILSYGEHAKILEPESLRDEMAEIAARMVEVYEGD
jgi:predicted DNA-binding transcriptional regulator YafY